MNPILVSVFPGQGSQVLGMGSGLLEKYDYYRRMADEVLGFPIHKVCNGELGNLNETQYTQPALYVVNILHYLDDLAETELPPDIVAGHSLGEYCALYAAGAFSFQTGLRIVQERGRLMASCRSGTMAAIQGLHYQDLAALVDSSTIESLAISNINSPSQVVVSGDAEAVPLFEPVVLEAGGNFHPLNVSGAFHSQRMADLAVRFRAFLEHEQIFVPKIPVLANVTADYYPTGASHDVVELLVQQLYSPVQWLDCMEKFSSTGSIVLREHGPKPTLTRLAQQTLEGWNVTYDNSFRNESAMH